MWPGRLAVNDARREQVDQCQAEKDRLAAALGLPVRWVELYADLETRLARNSGAARIAAKPSKADLVWSDENVRDMEQRLRMNTDPLEPTVADELLADVEHLRLDNAALTADEAEATAATAVRWLAPNATALLSGAACVYCYTANWHESPAGGGSVDANGEMLGTPLIHDPVNNTLLTCGLSRT